MNQIKNYFSKNQLILIVIILILGIILRWYQLDLRPFHHDESLHALYGKYMYEDPAKLFYIYDPMIHGPLLYHVLPFFYELFGINKESARALAASISTFFIFFSFAFIKYLKPRYFIFLFALLSFSPSLIYWGRFIREDNLMLFTFSLIAASFLTKNLNLKAFLIIFGILSPFLIKENALIHPVLLLSFFVVEYFFTLDKEKSIVINLKNILTQGKKGLWGALILFVFCYCYLYSGGFRSLEGINNNMLVTGFSYWFGQHQKERIPGPFLYQTLIFSSYDLICFLSVIISSLHLYKNCAKPIKIFWATFGFLFIFSYPLVKDINFSINDFWSWAKFKIPLDFYLFFLYLSQGALSTIILIKKEKNSLALLNFLFWSTLFTYSFVGERVPWLAMYPMIFGLIFCVYYFNEHDFLKGRYFKYIIAAVLIFNFRISLKTNFSEAGKENHLISQVHTTKIFEKILLKIKDKIIYPIERQPRILSLGETIWPTNWYFFGEPQFSFALRESSLKDFDYILTDIPNERADQELQNGYQKIIIPMRVWWLPNYEQITLFKWLGYALTHNPWSDPGAKDIALYQKIK